MNTRADSFLADLPVLLRLLANPVTPHTVLELWCRIGTEGWDECEPILLSELRSGNPDVQRLVMEIVVEEAERCGTESLGEFVPLLTTHLHHDNRVVRMVAIMAVRTFEIASEETITSLRQLACQDDPVLARESLLTMNELDEDFFNEVRQLLQGRSG